MTHTDPKDTWVNLPYTQQPTYPYQKLEPVVELPLEGKGSVVFFKKDVFSLQGNVYGAGGAHIVTLVRDGREHVLFIDNERVTFEELRALLGM